MIQRDRFITFLALIVVLGVSVENCSRGKELERMKSNLQSVELDNQKFESTVNLLGQEISNQRQTIVAKDEAIMLGLEQIKGFKNIKNQVKVVTQTTFDTIYAGFEKDTTQQNQLSNTFAYKEEWISFKGEVLDSGVAVKDLSIKNEYTITIADKKLGFFKKPEPSVILLNKNPYTRTEGMTNLTIKQNQPVYKRPWVWLTLGIGSGILISRL